MPITQLDTNAALVVIDLQKGIAAMAPAEPMAEVVAHSSKLASAFRERELTVVLVNVSAAAPGRTDAGPPKFAFPPDWTELMPKLNQQQSDLLVTKTRWGAFTGTQLDALLRERAVTQIILTGVATSVGVESTARWAHELGYNVVLASDAMLDRDPEAHRFTVEKVFPKLGEVDTTENILKMVKR